MSSNFGSISFARKNNTWVGFKFDEGKQAFEFGDYMRRLNKYVFKLLDENRFDKSLYLISGITITEPIASGDAPECYERMALIYVLDEDSGEQLYFYVFSEKEISTRKWRMTGKTGLMSGKVRLPNLEASEVSWFEFPY